MGTMFYILKKCPSILQNEWTDDFTSPPVMYEDFNSFISFFFWRGFGRQKALEIDSQRLGEGKHPLRGMITLQSLLFSILQDLEYMYPACFLTHQDKDWNCSHPCGIQTLTTRLQCWSNFSVSLATLSSVCLSYYNGASRYEAKYPCGLNSNA